MFCSVTVSLLFIIKYINRKINNNTDSFHLSLSYMQRKEKKGQKKIYWLICFIQYLWKNERWHLLWGYSRTINQRCRWYKLGSAIKHFSECYLLFLGIMKTTLYRVWLFVKIRNKREVWRSFEEWHSLPFAWGKLKYWSKFYVTILLKWSLHCSF
jgi:hypothetical protein